VPLHGPSIHPSLSFGVVLFLRSRSASLLLPAAAAAALPAAWVTVVQRCTEGEQRKASIRKQALPRPPSLCPVPRRAPPCPFGLLQAPRKSGGYFAQPHGMGCSRRRRARRAQPAPPHRVKGELSHAATATKIIETHVTIGWRKKDQARRGRTAATAAT
jgi:hypothetical protein